MQSTFVAPKVGCQHFKSVVKNIRSEPNTLLSCMLDILDNVYGVANAEKTNNVVVDINIEFHAIHTCLVHRITISDNLPRGFCNILDTSVHNPLNMGHIRDGHSNDCESSEFGTGLKKSIIFMSECAEIFTRSVQEDGTEHIVHVKFDIPSMMNCTDPQQSYEPTEFELISLADYSKKHKFQQGSSIVLQNLNVSDFSFDEATGNHFSKPEFEASLLKSLGKAYFDIIRRGIFRIDLNGISVEEHLDSPSSVLVAPEYQTNFTFYVKLNHRNDVEKIYRIGVTEKEKRTQYCVFDSAINGKEKFVSCDRDELLEFQSAANVFEMQLVSVTTLRTEHKDSKQHHDHTDIVRDGRCYDPPIKYTSMVTDGYSNHIYNRISYVSKRLNKAIGVGPNKRVAKPSNMLTSAILDTQKKTTAKYRKWAREDAEKNSCARKEAEKKASENDNVILREIPVASPALPPDVMGSFFRFQSGDILVDGAPFTEVVVPVPSSKKRSREESFQPFTLQEFGRIEEMDEPLPAATVPQCLHADEEPAVSMILEEVAVDYSVGHDSLEAVEDSVKYCIVSGENDVVVSIPSNEAVEVTPEEVVEVTSEEVVELISSEEVVELISSEEVVEVTSGEVVEVTSEEVVEMTSGEVVEATSGEVVELISSEEVVEMTSGEVVEVTSSEEVVEMTSENNVLENGIEDVVADVLKDVVERFVSDCMDVVDDAFERNSSLESPSPSVPPPLPPVCNVHASRQTILQSVNCMLDLIADPAFNREDGYLFTDFVNAYLHK